MSFHDKVSTADKLQTIYQPVDDDTFADLLEQLDASMSAKPKPAKRGIVRWWFK